jgi:hypothetical protein
MGQTGTRKFANCSKVKNPKCQFLGGWWGKEIGLGRKCCESWVQDFLVEKMNPNKTIILKQIKSGEKTYPIL